MAVWAAAAAALPLRRLASPRYANSGVYRDLTARHKELELVGETLDPKDDPEAWAVLQASLETVKTSLAQDGRHGDGTAWAGGAVYVVVHNHVHRAEQALTMLQPEPEVVRQALYERSCLLDSRIANAQRTRLFVTVVLTGLVAYSGLDLALLAGAGTTQLIAGGTFYLIGATVGLFRQLGQAATADAVTEEDFGLGMVRLVYISLASGLAAIGGVVVTAYVTALNSSTEVPALSEVFDIAASPLGLVSAAVFGFTPSLLASSLQSRADQWKEELNSSSPGEKEAS